MKLESRQNHLTARFSINTINARLKLSMKVKKVKLKDESLLYTTVLTISRIFCQMKIFLICLLFRKRHEITRWTACCMSKLHHGKYRIDKVQAILYLKTTLFIKKFVHNSLQFSHQGVATVTVTTQFIEIVSKT